MYNSVEVDNFKVAFINIRGQTGLTSSKQHQIESFLVRNNIDVLHLQEVHISEESFSTCNVISSSYNIISNNSSTKYGTATLIRSEFVPENILLDSNGRVIVFNIGGITLATCTYLLEMIPPTDPVESFICLK